MRHCSFLFAPCAQTLVALQNYAALWDGVLWRRQRECPLSSRRLGPPFCLGCPLTRTSTLL